MTRTLNWISTTGGPHLLIAAEQIKLWRGSDGWFDHCDPADQSDYARACRITTWMGKIRFRHGSAIVLSGEAGDIAWFPTERGDQGFLVQWLACDDEHLIAPALHSAEMRNLLNDHKAEQLEFNTGLSGAMWLIDASERGRDLRGHHQILALRQGRYLAKAAYWESPGLMIVVREMTWLEPPVHTDS